MIDLGKIFKKDSTPVEVVEKAEPEAAPVSASPTIVGLVVEKSECCMAEISKILGDAGFKTDAQEDQDDGTVIFKQADDIAGADVVRVNSALLALVKDFPKVSSPVVAKAEGFVPGIDITFGGLFEAVSALALSDEPAAEKVSKVESFFKDASALIASHVQHFPSALFSAGGALEAMTPVAKAEEDPPAEPEVEAPTPTPEEVATPPVEDNAELIQKIAQGKVVAAGCRVLQVMICQGGFPGKGEDQANQGEDNRQDDRCSQQRSSGYLPPLAEGEQFFVQRQRDDADCTGPYQCPDEGGKNGAEQIGKQQGKAIGKQGCV